MLPDFFLLSRINSIRTDLILDSKCHDSFNRYNPCFVTHFISLKINWDEVLKKKAHGNNDYDIEEVDAVESDAAVTKKGIKDKDKFYLLRA